jgi:hypothetical protein
MKKDTSIDSEGNPIIWGDWVAFETAPDSLLKGLPPEDQEAIQQQAGSPLQIVGFSEHGNAELEFRSGEHDYRTIWIEPKHLVKVRFTPEALTVSNTRNSKREKEWRHKVVQAWIKMSQTLRSGEDNMYDWASLLMYDLVQNRPEEAWILIDALRHATDDLQVLAHLAAGHLEDLLAQHGDKFIDRFEALAKQDTDFRQMLGGVWQNSMSDEVWERVQAIALRAKWD